MGKLESVKEIVERGGFKIPGQPETPALGPLPYTGEVPTLPPPAFERTVLRPLAADPIYCSSDFDEQDWHRTNQLIQANRRTHRYAEELRKAQRALSATWAMVATAGICGMILGGLIAAWRLK